LIAPAERQRVEGQLVARPARQHLGAAHRAQSLEQVVNRERCRALTSPYAPFSD